MCWYKDVTMIIIILISINIIIILLHLWVLLLQHNLNAGKQSKFLMSVEQRKHWKYSWQLSIHWRKSNTNPVIPLKVFWLLNRREKTSKKLYNLVTLNIGNFSTNFQKKKKARLWANTNRQKLSWVCSDNHKCFFLFSHSFTCLHWLGVWNRLHQKWFR